VAIFLNAYSLSLIGQAQAAAPTIFAASAVFCYTTKKLIRAILLAFFRRFASLFAYRSGVDFVNRVAVGVSVGNFFKFFL
jgi:hypothetical protein